MCKNHTYVQNTILLINVQNAKNAALQYQPMTKAFTVIKRNNKIRCELIDNDVEKVRITDDT